jgi:DNA-binding NarL/FixJ family response regulator
MKTVRIVEGMLAARAAGYILKLSAPEELVKGIRAEMRGDVYIVRQNKMCNRFLKS